MRVPSTIGPVNLSDSHIEQLKAVWNAPARFFRDEQGHIVGPGHPYNLLPQLEKWGMVVVDPIYKSYKPKKEDAKGIVVQITALGMKAVRP